MPKTKTGRSGRMTVLALTVAAFAGSATADGLVDTFSITIGDTVSDGVPGPGAGNLERPGSRDVYLLDMTAETLVYFDEISGSCSIVWRCEAPDGTVLFNNNAICVTDPGSFTLDQIGQYTIEVYSNNDTTGTYSFKLWEVPPPDEFDIGLNQSVSLDNPGPGAGHIEQPASVDIYTLYINEPVLVYFDEISGPCNIQWRCEAPDATVLFNNNAICVTDPGEFWLDQVGEYTISVYGSQSAVGTYSFKVWTVPPPDEFDVSLDQVVSLDDPGPGAGHIEQPGSVDVYTLSIDAPVLVYFDEITGPCNIQWRCEAPDGTMLFNNNAICVTDPGEYLLDLVGDYTISVYGNQSAVGTYSFAVWTVEDVQHFTLDLDQVVSDGVPEPGAGNIEEPASVDAYTLTITDPTLVYFDSLAGSCSLRWRCEAPDGTVLFNDHPMCLDTGLHMLDQIGDYIIRASGNQSATGTYSFVVWDVGEPDEFIINLDETVSEGVPGEGAGYIEKPGRSDIYYLTVDANTSVCFETISGSCTLRMSVDGPDGPVFASTQWCGGNPGKYNLKTEGEYAITVQATGDYVGAYSFIANTGRVADLDGNCAVDVSDLLLLLGAWGNCPRTDDCPADINGDGTVDVSDLLLLLGDWG